MTTPILLTAADIAQLDEAGNRHQFNSQAVRFSKSLGDITGLTQCGVHLVRVEPGFETTQHHRHHYCDEFVYIISGTGIAKINDDEVTVGAGDFMGFPAKGAAHSMRNTSDVDLVYLMGGDRVAVDVCDYPDIQRRMYLLEDQREYVEWDELKQPKPTLIESIN